jgi:hypothetical protein
VQTARARAYIKKIVILLVVVVSRENENMAGVGFAVLK